MVFKLIIREEEGNMLVIEKDFTSKDIKNITGVELPKEDKAGEYLYVIGNINGVFLPYYYYKMGDNINVPTTTKVSIETKLDDN